MAAGSWALVAHPYKPPLAIAAFIALEQPCIRESHPDEGVTAQVLSAPLSVCACA